MVIPFLVVPGDLNPNPSLNRQTLKGLEEPIFGAPTGPDGGAGIAVVNKGFRTKSEMKIELITTTPTATTPTK